jgi:hypothetical protein
MPLFKVTATSKNPARRPVCLIVDTKDEEDAKDAVGVNQRLGPEVIYKVEPYVPTPDGAFWVLRVNPLHIVKVSGVVDKKLLDARWHKIYQERITWRTETNQPRWSIIGHDAFATEAEARDLALRITQAKLGSIKAIKAKLDLEEAQLLAFVRELAG